MPDVSSPWWHPAKHADRRPFLAQRSAVRARLGAWFAGQGFTEVDCSVLQVSPGNETHLHAFATQFVTEAGVATPLYLHTSPEFSAKKLLAAGETRIVDFARVFRNRETGPLHAPEFTMAEWYRTGAALADIMADCTAVCAEALAATGRRELTWKSHAANPALTPEVLTLVEAKSIWPSCWMIAMPLPPPPARAGLHRRRIIRGRIFFPPCL
jgi:elongation factor P--(R)-beta-lysine ligase